MYKPDFLALLEPRISGGTADRVWKMIRKKNWFKVKTDGFSGGI